MKKVISVVLIVALLLSIGIFSSYASEEYGAVVESGYCGEEEYGCQGEDAQWFLYEDGTLVISGTGKAYSPDVSEYGSSYFSTEFSESVKRVVIEEGITEIMKPAFTAYINVTEVSFPKTMTRLGDSAFMHSYSLDAFIPEWIEEIGVCAFMFAKSITVDENNPYYSSDEYGVLFNKDKTELVVYPGNAEYTEYSVPDGVEKICESAGQYCPTLRKITFPESLKEIESGVFAICTNLETVVFSEGIEKIGGYAFMLCENLKNAELPMSLKFVSELAFLDCYFLKDIKIKSSDAQYGQGVGLVSMRPADGVTDEEWIELYKKAFGIVSSDEANSLFYENSEVFDDFQPTKDAVIFIHDDDKVNTAEAYAVENSIPVEKGHFYNTWVYDWDNCVRTSKCDLCDMTVTEDLEKETQNEVEIIAPEDSDADFEVDKITDSDDDRYVLAKEAVNELENEVEIVKMFDISLKNKDGVHVQPDGTVKVKLPHDWKHENYKVYRLNDDGTLTDMNAYREGSHLVFETDHFSVYIVVEGSAQADSDAENGLFGGINELLTEFVVLLGKILSFFGEILGYLGIEI